MSDADPLTGDDPYEALGVSPDDSLEAIRERKDELLNEYRSRMREVRQDRDNEAFKESAEAIKEIEHAWEWLEGNHEPVDTDGPSNEAAAALDLPADAAPGTIEARRDRLLDEHRERMRKARHEDDNEGFKTAANRIEEIERAAERLLAERSEPEAEQEHDDQAPDPGSDGPALSAADPYELLGLSRDASEAELAARRDELVVEYTARLTPETYADEPWRFRQALRATAAVDDAWRAIEGDRTADSE
ncbi:J domain-containing protein [Haloglomus halophilum]|uniref:J domain-containing protein n=1 Tax=Haloglomus halophilum TaxID=2962672 RepID=UPI0020C97BC5|nr:J domain-containing protein [Haloglomus halophilum]